MGLAQMTCRVCGLETSQERDTGYAGAGICTPCAAEGWTEYADGTIGQENVEPAREEPPEDDDAWSGGFSSNH